MRKFVKIDGFLVDVNEIIVITEDWEYIDGMYEFTIHVKDGSTIPYRGVERRVKQARAKLIELVTWLPEEKITEI
jgi:hypothetical protein